MPAAFEQAFHSGDIQQVLALYEGAAVLVAQPGQVVHGTAAIREALQGFLSLKLPIQLERERVLVMGERVLVSSTWRLCGTGPTARPSTWVATRPRWCGVKRMAPGATSSAIRSASSSLAAPALHPM
jgi:ketosteroid isomerase-like protein